MVLHFYDAQWNHVGGKTDLITELSQLTSISENVLMDSDWLKKVCNSTKMSWAAGLSAEPIEDAAYSLLGIFNVNIPINYGEGMGSFIRLQEAVLRNATDYSLLAWQPRTNQLYRGLLAHSPLEYSHFKNSSKGSPNLQGGLKIQSDGINVYAGLGGRGNDLLLPLPLSDGTRIWIVLSLWDGMFVRNCMETVLDDAEISNFATRDIVVRRDVSLELSRWIATHRAACPNHQPVNGCGMNGANTVVSAPRKSSSIPNRRDCGIQADSQSTRSQFPQLSPTEDSWPRSPSLRAQVDPSDPGVRGSIPSYGPDEDEVGDLKPRPYSRIHTRTDKNCLEHEYPRLSRPVKLLSRTYDCVVIGPGYKGTASRPVRAGESACVPEREQDRSGTVEAITANSHIAWSADAANSEAADVLTREDPGSGWPFGLLNGSESHFREHDGSLPNSPSRTRSQVCETVDGESSKYSPGNQGEPSRPGSPAILDPEHPFAAVTEDLKVILVDRFLSTCSSRPGKRALLSWSQTARKRPKLDWSAPYMDVELASDSEDMDTVVVHHAGERTGTFVCPFYLMDKKRHETCLTRHNLSTIDEVKEHIWESHLRPNFCPICKTTFATLSARDHHIRGRNCEHRESPTFDGLTDGQIQQLARQGSHVSSRESQWYELWDIVSPSGRRPVSPYYSSEREFRVVALRRFSEVNGRDIISDFLRERGLQGWEVSDEERNLAILFNVVLHDAIDEVHRRFAGEEQEQGIATTQ